MLSKKVLTFVEFINENYNGLNQINEADSWTPSKEDILRVLDIQEKIGKSRRNQKVAPLGSYKPAYVSLETYNSLAPDLQEKAISDIQKAFSEKNVPQKRFEKFVKALEENIEKQNGFLTIKYSGAQQPFYITVTKDKLEKKEKIGGGGSKWNDDDVSLISDADVSQFFKNNMYEIKEDALGDTFVNQDLVKQVLDLIDKKIVEAYEYYVEEGTSGISEIEISTSCSRYRNTGPAEDLSWAELAYKRVGTFAKYIQIKAKEISKNDGEFVEQIRQATGLYFLGSNGDGTSGPDPKENEKGETVRRGYYIKVGTKSKWEDVSKGNLNEINLVEVITEKLPPVIGTKATKVKAKDQDGVEIETIPATPKDYDKYKYFQISIKGKSKKEEEGGTTVTQPTERVIVTDKYSVKVLIPRKQEIEMPKLKIRIKTRGKTYKRKKRKGWRWKKEDCPAY